MNYALCAVRTRCKVKFVLQSPPKHKPSYLNRPSYVLHTIVLECATRKWETESSEITAGLL